MFKNKSYIGISFIILVFGIYAVPKILNRIQQGEVVKGIAWIRLMLFLVA
jgi:protein SCO1/2